VTAQLSVKKADEYFRKGNYQKSIEEAKDVLEKAVADDDTLIKGHCSLIIGKAFTATGSYLAAIEYLFTALKISERDKAFKAEVLTALGDVYKNWGGDRKALEYYQAGDSVSENIYTRRYISEACGDVFLNMGNHTEAIRYYNNSLKMTDGPDYVSRQRVYKKKADIFLAQADYTKALEMEFLQLEIADKRRQTGLKSTILNNIGYLYNFRLEYDKALSYFRKSREVSVELNKTDSLYITLINIGAIYNIRKELDSSLSALNEALVYVKNDPDKSKEATVRNYLAATLMEFKKYSEALENNQKAINIVTKTGNQELLAKCYFIRSKILEQRGKVREQKYYSAQYKRITDSLHLINLLQRKRKAVTDSLIQVKESKIQQLLLGKELDYLSLRHYHLLSVQREKDVQLLAQQNSLSMMELNNEKLKKDQVHRMWLLSQKELENEKKENEIFILQKLKTEQELQVQKTTSKLNGLAKANLEKELAIQKKQAELSKSEQIKLRIILGFVISILVGFFVFRNYRLRQKAKENSLKLSNLEIQQRLLRSQMNPHFLFNSLNSIQGFITTNDAARADRFLACYARLIRSILDNTSREKISLFDELTALRSYIELEQMRMDNSFTFTINVIDLETDLVALPPMLIQPYVENAIVHGLRHKDSPGHLEIHLAGTEGFIICTIRDNGIGRKASQEINARKSRQYQSVAMNLTRERLELLNARENSDMSVEINDLFDEKGNASGTEVTLRILMCEYI
jgi:tetratricopeptide (TPR) repeat protein